MDFTYTLRSDGLRTSVTERQKEINGTFSDVKVSYEYDAVGRLTREFRDVSSTPGAAVFSATGLPDSAGDYVDTFTFDLNANRKSKTHDEVGTTSDSVTAYTYNERDQLLAEGPDANDDGIPDPTTATTHTYDPNGSQITTTKDGVTTRYVWDLRNRMTGIDANNDGDTADTGDTTIAYDTNGVRVRQQTGSTTTTYLNDPLNPTGYTKAIEERTNGTLARSYILGHRVEGQADTQGTVYLLTDGHGSTRALIDLTTLAIAERQDYDAFGTLLGLTSPAQSRTPWLFGGDGLYDPATGWTYHLARWRDGFRFTSYDSFEADPASPASLHKYSYTNANPVSYIDPTGRFTYTELVTTFAVSAGINVFVSLVSGERNPKTIIINALISGALTVATGGLINGVTSHITNVLVRTLGYMAIAGSLGFIQSVISQYLLNDPNEPIDYDRALAAAIVSAIVAGFFGIALGDKYDGGTKTEDEAKQLYDLCASVVAEGAGSSADALYDFVRELQKNAAK